jgi:hypothetical protein
MPSAKHQNRCVENKTKVKHVEKGREISKRIYNQRFHSKTLGMTINPTIYTI